MSNHPILALPQRPNKNPPQARRADLIFRYALTPLLLPPLILRLQSRYYHLRGHDIVDPLPCSVIGHEHPLGLHVKLEWSDFVHCELFH